MAPTFLMCLLLIQMVQGNWFTTHAEHMFTQHGKDAILFYEHPLTVRDFAMIPSLITDPEVVVGALQATLGNKGISTLFTKAGGQQLRSNPHRRFKINKYTKGMCFCCSHSGSWNNKTKDWGKWKPFYERLKNYSHCSDKFWLFGKGNVSVSVKTANQTTFSDIYPEYPMFQANYTGNRGSICSGWQARDPNLWFFYKKWATNYHPGNYQCVGVGYLTMPVQIVKPTRVRSKRDTDNQGQLVGPLGENCNDMVIVGDQMSKTESSRVAGGLFSGLLTLGAYPGVIAQENRKSILGLTCRLEKTINATSSMIRAMQAEIEDLSQEIAQQRFVLDYILAKQGGYCTIIGKGCRVTFQDLNKTIETELDRLQRMSGQNVRGISGPGDWFSWLTSWLPDFSWLKEMVLVVFAALFVCSILSCCFPCFIALIRRMQEDFAHKQMRMMYATLFNQNSSDL